MSNDRELLELAAMAAEYRWDAYGIRGDGNWWSGSEYLESWSPLTDDDALRLATKLRLDIMFFNGFEEVHCDGQVENDVAIIEPYGDDID